MKTFYYFPAIIIAFLSFLASCTQLEKYDNAIIDYLLKGSEEKAKFAVKIHNTKDLGKILINSNTIDTDQNEAKQTQLPQLEEQLAILQDELFKLEVKEDGSGRETMEAYITKISNLQQQIEYLKNEGADKADKDSTTVKMDENIMAVIVQSKYSIIYFGQDREVTETRSFVVSEDGKTCYGMANDFVETSK